MNEYRSRNGGGKTASKLLLCELNCISYLKYSLVNRITSKLDALVSYCCITKSHKLSGFKQYTFIINHLLTFIIIVDIIALSAYIYNYPLIIIPSPDPWVRTSS